MAAMKIAISVDGQFGTMTGVQYYVDSLLNALSLLETAHEITAFAPFWWAPLERMIALDTDGQWGWLRGTFRVDTAGLATPLSAFPCLSALPSLHPLADRIDKAVINRIKTRTPRYNERRARAAAARYDLLHTTSAARAESMTYRGRHNVTTIYDMTTRTRAEAHLAETIQITESQFEYARSCCDRVITISEFSKRDIMEHLGIAEDRIDVTPLAARTSTRRIEDPVELAQVLQQYDLTDTPFVLYAGTLEPRKNLMRLVRAFAQAAGDGSLTEHKLVLAGGHWGEHDRELRDLAQELGIDNQLLLTGYVSNQTMNALMSACAAFVYVSEYEGFGLPPLEAMVCGAPVVASNTTSLPEVVGDAGIQVPPTDVEAIAAALHRLLTDDCENARRRQLSLARAQEFNWARTAGLTLRSYEAAVA